MKKFCMFMVVLMAFGAAVAAAQPVAGKKFELGTAVSFFSIKEDGSEGGSWGYLTVPVRFGYFIWKGLEIEPEIQVTIPVNSEGKGDTTYFLLGNLTYNFATSGKLVPFIGGGAGFGNGIPFFLGLVEGSSDEKTFAFDGVVGLKYIIAKVAALRAEYRFNRFTWDAPWMIEKEKGTFHQFFVGICLFF